MEIAMGNVYMNRYSYVPIKVYADRLQVWPVGLQFVVPGLITQRGGGVILFNKISVARSGPSRTGAPGQGTRPRLSSFCLSVHHIRHTALVLMVTRWPRYP